MNFRPGQKVLCSRLGNVAGVVVYSFVTAAGEPKVLADFGVQGTHSLAASDCKAR